MCSGIKSMERVLGTWDHLLTYGKGCLHQTLDDRSMVVLSLLEGVVNFPQLELCPGWNSSFHGTLPQLGLCPDCNYLSYRTHLLGIICKNIRSLLFSHHLDEKLDLKLNGGISAPTGTLRRHLFDGIMEMLEFLFCQFLLGVWLIYLVHWSLSYFTYMVI